MMRNRLNAGDFIVPIPLGIPITLEYSGNGILKSFSVWDFQSEEGKNLTAVSTDASEASMEHIRKSSMCPTAIALKGGTTYVKGVVLFSSHRIASCGDLPYAAIGDMLRMMCDGVPCKFYAISVESYAAKFKGSTPIRKWLSLNHFEILPGFLAPFNDPSRIEKLTRSQCASFLVDNDVMGYAIFNACEEILCSNSLSQQKVCGAVRNNFNEYGAVLSSFSCGDAGTFTTNYKDVFEYDIHEGTYLVFREGNIIDSYVLDDAVVKDARPQYISCSVCGKLMKAKGVTRCSDDQCLSRKYPMVAHMLSTLNLPIISFARYQSLVKKHAVESVLDIFDLDTYVDSVIEVSLTTLLSALITEVEVPDRRIIASFVSQCHNSAETVMYYAENPSKISSDLNLGNVRPSLLKDWFSQNENLLVLRWLIHSKQIKLVDTDKYYQAPPIFRNTTICVTGDFNLGTLQDVRGILGSYSASVTTELSPEVNFVVIGDKQSNIDGRVVSGARSASIPVMGENTFLKQFDLLDDIKANLL